MSWFIWCRKYELNVITYQSFTHLFYSIFYLMCACHHKSQTRNVLWKVSLPECWLMIRWVDRWGGRLPDCGTKGVSCGWGKGAGWRRIRTDSSTHGGLPVPSWQRERHSKCLPEVLQMEKSKTEDPLQGILEGTINISSKLRLHTQTNKKGSVSP